MENKKMITLNEKKEKNKVISADYSKEAGKLGRHNLSFKTGAFKDKKKEAKKYACRNKGRKNLEY
jgi:hypothetical protein